MTTVFIPSSDLETAVIVVLPPPPHGDYDTTAADNPRVTIQPTLQLTTVVHPSYNPDYIIMPELHLPKEFNFSGGLAALCLNGIICYTDLMGARERSKKEIH